MQLPWRLSSFPATDDDCRKYKSWKVTGILPWSALLFTGGFVLRAVAAWGHWDNLVIYIVSTVLLLAGP